LLPLASDHSLSLDAPKKVWFSSTFLIFDLAVTTHKQAQTMGRRRGEEEFQSWVRRAETTPRALSRRPLSIGEPTLRQAENGKIWVRQNGLRPACKKPLNDDRHQAAGAATMAPHRGREKKDSWESPRDRSLSPAIAGPRWLDRTRTACDAGPAAAR